MNFHELQLPFFFRNECVFIDFFYLFFYITRDFIKMEVRVEVDVQDCLEVGEEEQLILE